MKALLNGSLAFVIVVILSTLPSSCSSDKLPEPAPLEEIVDCDTVVATYVANVKQIIDNTCAYSTCHVAGSGIGNYSNFSGLQNIINSGRFESRVILQKDDQVVGMPPNYAPPGRPQDLTQEQLDVIRCWIEAGYPES
ncbi:MAG: hypothetical protein AAF798_14055 [Bacteroidota bacterium]